MQYSSIYMVTYSFIVLTKSLLPIKYYHQLDYINIAQCKFLHRQLLLPMEYQLYILFSPIHYVIAVWRISCFGGICLGPIIGLILIAIGGWGGLSGSQL